MKLSTTPFNILEYVSSFLKGEIVVNTDYQRSNEIWSAKARSFLIETILLGFPIPKLCLYQKTDLKKLTTRKEVVDGQQRTSAIIDFMQDKFPMRADADPPDAAGKLFSKLPHELQKQFVEYSLAVDLLVGATDDDIRELFRRINSYTAPLTAEEQRHAVFQGDFKWFIIDLCKAHTGFLRSIGAFTDRKIVRMLDARLYAEICLFIHKGIQTTKGTDLDRLYKELDDGLDAKKKKQFNVPIKNALNQLGFWPKLHETALIKKDAILNLLILAIAHQNESVPAVSGVYKFKHKKLHANAEANLLKLADVLELDEETAKKHFAAHFRAASGGGANVKAGREIRFRWLCRALEESFS